MGSKVGCGDSAAHIIDMHGHDAAKHVLDLACEVIQAGPEADREAIGRLARLMREIEARHRQQADLAAAGQRERQRFEGNLRGVSPDG